MIILNLPASKTKNTQPMTVSMEMVCMAKSWPRKNQSEHSDLLCHIIKYYIIKKYVKSIYVFGVLLSLVNEYYFQVSFS